MRRLQVITSNNTVGEFVDAFNNNTLSQSDTQWYLGEMLYNGILYTGLETIGGQQVKTFTNLNIANITPRELVLDNFYLYFRDINKILLIDNMSFDLSPYKTGHPMFFYINSEMGFRVSQELKQEDGELLLLRFIISPEEVFQQMYVIPQRFGSSVYDGSDEFYAVKGCVPLSAGGLKVKLSDGNIKRSGIKFDYHPAPDVFKIEESVASYDIRYIEPDNTVTYFKSTQQDVIHNKILNYTTGEFTTVPAGQYSAQRILFDIYQNCLIFQYGDSYYADMASAMSSIDNLGYPFPYDNLVFIPIGVMFIKSGTTDLSVATDCMLLQQTTTTVSRGSSLIYAEDVYARGKLGAFQDQINNLRVSINTVNSNIEAHKKDTSNPHKVTKSQVGLGNVDNYSRDQLQTTFDSRYVRTSGNVTKQNDFISTGVLGTQLRYILVGGIRVYVGGADGGQRWGDYLLP